MFTKRRCWTFRYFDSRSFWNLPVEKTRVDFLIRGQPLDRSYVRSTWPTLRSKILTRSKFQSHGGHDGLDFLSFWRLLEFFREFVPQRSWQLWPILRLSIRGQLIWPITASIWIVEESNEHDLGIGVLVEQISDHVGPYLQNMRKIISRDIFGISYSQI